MKDYFGTFLGNESIKKRLSYDVEHNGVSHAFILEGNEGSGRHTLALQLASAISCKNKSAASLPCGKCDSCKKILSGKSPDVINLGVASDKVTIGIETARLIKESIHISPNDLPIKMYIIEDADKMTLQAQNALLLSLEEPPQYVIFILICKDSTALLETIKSRAPILHLEKLSTEDIESYLLEKYQKARQIKDEFPEEFSELLLASGGTLGRAIDLLDDRDRKKEMTEREIARKFIDCSLDRSRASKFEMISSLGSKRHDITPRLVRIQHALRDLIILKKADSPELIFYSDVEYASELSTKFTLERLMDMYTAIAKAIDDLTANANIRLCLLSMMYASNLLD